MPTETKLAWIEAELAAGVREIEVASIVPAKLLPQMADAEPVIRQSLALPGLTVAVLIPNLKGAERAIGLNPHKFDFVMSVSESHNMNNVRRTTAESLEDFRRIAELARSVPGRRPVLNACLATAFGCTLEGTVDEDKVRRFAALYMEAGADELAVADTVGYGNPKAVYRVFRAVLDEIGKVPVYAHFHDTRGLGLANVHAALEAGVRAFDSSLGGLGGCPYAPGATGNIVTEDLAFMLAAMGMETGIDLDKLVKVRRILSENLANVPLHGNIHQAGLPKNFTKVPTAA
jgi:hydroxymethylglutaryl-CoA lyase